ncbi:hypothetical protein F511_23330 [Dorcoceras hygrometricum]|uniref:Uncharacterized protein n=1 Tax=Dorcoceras hygrometricum TaxID=472368 RepID=A0A2Z7ACX7_9LAMI|nr:hypothetical protein F511_23330 [Dorcoceras hygrometricum]
MSSSSESEESFRVPEVIWAVYQDGKLTVDKFSETHINRQHFPSILTSTLFQRRNSAQISTRSRPTSTITRAISIVSRPFVSATNKDPEQQSTEPPYIFLDASAISFVSKPSGSASLDFIRRLVPDQDFDQLKRAPDLGSLRLLASISCSSRKYGIKRIGKGVSQARARGNPTIFQGSGAVPGSPSSMFLGGKQVLQAKPVFDEDLHLFKKGFDGCLAQFRANGYSEEEHPASFLDVEQALVDMPEDEDAEEGSSGREEDPAS